MANKKQIIINILDILKRYTDENHRLSQKEIADILKNEYNMKIDRKSVKRNLSNLLEFGYPIEYSESIRMVPNPKTGELEESYMLSDFYLLPSWQNYRYWTSWYACQTQAWGKRLWKRIWPFKAYVETHLYVCGQKHKSAVYCRKLYNQRYSWYFGNNVEFSNETKEKITVTTVNEQDMRLWAMQYALQVKVISPRSLVDDIRNDLQKTAERYKRE